MKFLISILFLSAVVFSDVEVTEKPYISCNDGALVLIEVRETEGDSLFLSYILKYNSEVISKDLTADAVDFEEYGDEETFHVFDSADGRTHVQIKDISKTGHAFLRPGKRFYPRIIELKKCKFE